MTVSGRGEKRGFEMQHEGSIKRARERVRGRTGASEIPYDPPQDCKLVGVMRAICGIKDAVGVIHARPGCHCGILLLRALGSHQNDIRIVSSGVRAQDMVYGAEGRLSAAIGLSYFNFKPALIAVMNCSAPAIMGDDVEGVAQALKDKIPAEILTFSTGGYEGPAWLGYEEALAELTKFMDGAAKTDRGAEKTVNILGFKRDDPRALADIQEIERMLHTQGVSVNAVLTNASFNEIKNAPRASLNVVLGGDGLKCAEAMEERFDMPFVVVPYPYGLRKSRVFLERIAEGLDIELNENAIQVEEEYVKERIERVFLFLQGIYDASIAVIGDAGRAFDLAQFLSEEVCMNVEVLALTSQNHHMNEMLSEAKEYAECVLIEPDRFEMSERIKASEVELLFGTSFEKKIAWELRAPLIRMFYPVIDEVTISDTPFAGFRGTVNIIESIINAVIHNYLAE